MATPVESALCPFFSYRKVQPQLIPESDAADVSCDAQGVWHIHSFAAAKLLLRSPLTCQAGFGAEQVQPAGSRKQLSVLFLDGRDHAEARAKIARFFTPKNVQMRHTEWMTTLATALVAKLAPQTLIELVSLSSQMAVQVTARIIGLSNSDPLALAKRLDFCLQEPNTGRIWHFSDTARKFSKKASLAQFLWLDLKPAIKARRQQPLADLISQLLLEGHSEADILEACLAYSAAGIVPTREFISIAAWHLLEQPVLRAQFLAAPLVEQQFILQEILRIEPAVGEVCRRTTTEVHLYLGGNTITIPAHRLLKVHIQTANIDETVTGGHPLAICPTRELAQGAQPAVLAFGEGDHRCLGAYIAMQASAIFLNALLRLPALQIEKTPTITWNPNAQGYELRNFWLRK